jgi:hypothetical protein
MGTNVELNDTLLITEAQGFPANLLNRDKHVQNPIAQKSLDQQEFKFDDKDGARIFHLDPVRVYLVENINGKWLFWGKAFIVNQTISKKLGASGEWKPGDWVTSGTYKIVEIFEPEYQEAFTRRECPPGKSFFA